MSGVLAIGDSYEDLVKAIGESVFIHFEPHEPEHPWTVGLTHTPLIHEHWPSMMEGLAYLVKHKDKFPEWRAEIEKVEGRSPGETLKVVMETKGLTTTMVLAGARHLTLGRLQAILDGVGKITPEVATDLAVSTGIPSWAWINMEDRS